MLQTKGVPNANTLKSLSDAIRKQAAEITLL